MNICALGGGKRAPLLRAGLEYVDSPNVLIIPTACSTEKSHDGKVASCIRTFDELGIPCVVLHGFGETPTAVERAHKFGEATLLYVIGGNSPYLMGQLDEHGTDQDIVDATKRGVMLGGTSAGVLLPFAVGHSCPVPDPEAGEWDYKLLPMLGLVRAAGAVHASKHDPTKSLTRLEDFAERFPAEYTQPTQLSEM